jgi:hypothetical protein
MKITKKRRKTASLGNYFTCQGSTIIKIIHAEDSPMKTNSKVILAVGLALLPKINPKFLPSDSNKFISKSLRHYVAETFLAAHYIQKD